MWARQGGILKAVFWWFVVIALLGLVGSVFFEQALLFISLGLLVSLGGYFYHLNQLRQFLQQHRCKPVPGARGMWADVYAAVSNIRQHHNSRNRRFSSILQRCRGIAAILPEAVLVLDQNSDVIWCNAASSRLLGVSLPHASGKNLSEILRHPVWQEYRQAGDFSRPLELQSPVDDARILSLQLLQFSNSEGEYLLLAHDITDVYKLDQARRDFVANVSHELRTPLTVIKGFLDAPLAETDFSLEQPRIRELMCEQADRMQNMINDLLALSRLEMDSGKQVETAVPVADLLEKIIADAAILSGPENHVFKLEVDTHACLSGDEAALRSVFSNLVFNAVKHTPGRTEIHVHWWADEFGAYLCVSDTGSGIAARHIPRLTEKFYRVDEGRAQQDGTGLGLSIVQNILTRHDAQLRINSEEGRGSSFTCDFPLTRLVL